MKAEILKTCILNECGLDINIDRARKIKAMVDELPRRSHAERQKDKRPFLLDTEQDNWILVSSFKRCVRLSVRAGL